MEHIDGLSDFLLEVRRRFHPGKPVEIALGKAFLAIDPDGYLPSETLLRLDEKLEALSVRADVANEMRDFLFGTKGVKRCTVA